VEIAELLKLGVDHAPCRAGQYPPCPSYGTSPGSPGRASFTACLSWLPTENFGTIAASR
jgi:hypothetical protein